MQKFLMRRNQDLLASIRVLMKDFDLAQIPEELTPYKIYMLKICSLLKERIELQISYLKLGKGDLLEDIISNTNQLTERVRLLSSQLAIPVFRASKKDRLSLFIIHWLHQEHQSTNNYPPAFFSGSFAIYPFKFAPIYLIPTVEQSGLLYQPLLFHEFGHLLYECHRPEMDELVTTLKQEVVDLLRPVSQRNDRFAEQQSNKQQIIADTWYSWIQELFCDAVGFEIGGPCFLFAFSSYLSSLSEADFRRYPNDLWLSSHPVSWLRVRFLRDRAIKKGFMVLAEQVWNEWCMTANVLGIIEDYFGFYHESLYYAVSETLENMIEETSPREFLKTDISGSSWDKNIDTPVKLLNLAWKVNNENPRSYSDWEKTIVENFWN